jgi:hypothetical protein
MKYEILKPDNKNLKAVHMYRYDNVSDYYKSALATENRTGMANQSRNGSQRFTNSSSFEETQARYTKGYPDATSKAKAIRMKITPYLRTVSGVKPKWQPQRYAGGNFILSNYVRGLPEVCNVMTATKSKKFASIILNGSASCGVNINTMLARGVAVTCLADVLELNGYRTAIKLVYCATGSSLQTITSIDIKNFDQPPELDRLAFFLTDPSAMRRLYFSWLENLPQTTQADLGVGYGYGTPSELVKAEIGDKDIYIGCMHWDLPAWHSVEETVTWIKETLKRYGIDSRS